MERHTRLSRAAVVLVTIALIASIAAAVWFASPDAPYVPSEDSGAALGTAAPAEDGTVASGYQPSGTGISDGSTAGSAIQTIRNSKSGTYYLTNDIVVNSLTDCTFSGTLDGNGKTVYIRYDSEVTGEPGVNTELGIGALFGNLNGATIKNVKIVVETFRYVEGSAGTRNVGIIAGDAWGGAKIENVYVELQYSPTSDGRSYFLDSGEHSGSAWSGTKEVELNFGAVLGKSGSSDAAATDVTLKNVTVDNQTSGNYGFSAWIRHGDYCNYKVSMGHFVGWVTGKLSMQNCTLRGGESAKMTIKKGGSGGSTTNQSGAVIGRLDEQSGSTPSLTIAGLDMEMAINFDDHAVMNNISGNNGIIYGNDANNAYTVSVSDIFWNENSGNPGWYDGQGNDTITYSNLTKYDPNVIDISFDKDGDKVLLSAKAQYVNDASSIVNQIGFNGNTYTVWDKLIATDADTVGQWTQVVTVAKPKSNAGGSITYTKMGTGTFTIEGGETITGVSGNSYTAEREYDGNVPQSPSIVLSGGGGSFGEVWKAEGASANVGQYTMTFDKSVLTAAGSVVAAGSDGLTYIAKNGIVYSPGSMEQIGQLNIVNNINVNITQASVTVKPSTPTTGLYAGNPMPELTATAVDSGGSPVEGSIEWDDPNATLVLGKHSYAWTWTPNSSNYQTVKDSMELEAFDRKIESLTVQGDFKKKYIAYEPFNPTGVEVIATYSDGTQAKLDENKYEFTVVNGDINRLVVVNDTVTVSLKAGSTVSTTFNIEVSKLVVDVPTAVAGLVYNGAEQTGVGNAEHYTLTGNTGTNAAAYTATATLTYPENTRWNTVEADDIADKSIKWSIAKKNVAITGGHTGKTYDGQVVDPTTLFTAPNGVDGQPIALAVTVEGGKTILNAGTYSVTASLAESVTNYTADSVTITYTVNKKLVSGEIVADNLVYDGTEKGATFNGQLIGEDKVEIKYAGDRRNVTEAGFTATAVLPSSGNYAWADDAATSATFMILPKEITVTATTGSKEFAYIMASASDLYELFELDGEAVNAKDKLIWKVNGEVVDMSNGNVSEIFDAKEYKIEIASADANYTLTGQTSTTFTITPKKVEKPTVSGERKFTFNGTEQGFTIVENEEYEVKGDAKAANAGDYSFSIALKAPGNVVWSDGTTETITVSWKINKATPAVTVKLSDDMPGNLTVAATLDNAWLVRTDNTGVEGTLAWDKAGALLQQGKVEYDWTFVPTDSNNYNNATGFLSITASEDTLQSIMVKDGTYRTEYTAYEDFDPTGLVVIAHYASGTAVEVTSGFTLKNDKALTDGEITVTLNGVSTTITVTVNKREIPLPTATEGLVFNGEEQNGIDQKWIEQYAEFVKVEGNSQRDAGDYWATVTLTKDTNYVTWADGSDADVSIPWTIAQMTLDGTVLAAGRLEYDGNAKEATFNRTSGELFNGDAVTIEYSGNNVNVTEAGFTATAVLPSGDNYAWADDTAPSATFKISPKAVEIESIQELTKTYDGEPVDPSSLFPAPNGVDGQPLVLTVTVDGGATILNAGSYTVTAVLAQGQPNYTAKQAVAEYSVSKANPTVNPTADVQGTLYTSDDLYDIALNLGAQDTPGTVSWDEGQRLIADEQGYNWTFVPTDSVNYNGATGVIKLTAVQAQLVSVTVDVMPDTAYTAFDAFDLEGMVVTAHYPNGDTKQVALNDLSLTVDQGSIDRLVVASTTVTVSYSDGGVTMSDTITIEVSPLKVAAPTAKTDLVYNGAEQTGVEEGEHYTLSGDTTATNAGVYSATAKLKDKANTTWEDGSTDDVLISWTITEPVTSDEVIADILAMEKVTWQNAEEFLDLEARYNALDKSEQTADATAKLEVLKAQYDALRNAAFDDIEAAHEVTAKSLGKALAAAAAGLSAAAIALAIAKRRSI